MRSSVTRSLPISGETKGVLRYTPVGYMILPGLREFMAHTVQSKKKLQHRIRRIRGQLNAIEKALSEEKECSTILLTLAACRGAMDSLMAEILEGHVRFHVLDPAHKPNKEQKKAAEEIITIVRRYLR